MSTAEPALAHDVHHGPPRPTGFRRITGPGWIRAAWMAALFFGIGTALGPGIRAAIGYDPVFQDQVWATVLMVAVPMGFLGGLGTCD